MKQFLRKASSIILGLGLVCMFAVSPAGASHSGESKDYTLYEDGSVSCTGADDLSSPGGKVYLTSVPGGVHFTVVLRYAEPNRSYTIAISEEPNCANAQFYPNAIQTDRYGNGTYRGFYATSSGQHNLLINLSTSNVSDPRHREISTTDAFIWVP